MGMRWEKIEEVRHVLLWDSVPNGLAHPDLMRNCQREHCVCMCAVWGSP